jgi:hypothetical protein
MRIILIAFGLLLSCRADKAVPASKPSLDPLDIAFVSHCRFSNGSHILLVHKFGTDTYRFIIGSRGNNEVSTIRRGQDGSLEIETNGGVGKILAVENLQDWLLKQPFRAVSESAFLAEIRRKDVPSCPGTYPFSP